MKITKKELKKIIIETLYGRGNYKPRPNDPLFYIDKNIVTPEKIEKIKDLTNDNDEGTRKVGYSLASAFQQDEMVFPNDKSDPYYEKPYIGDDYVSDENKYLINALIKPLMKDFLGERMFSSLDNTKFNQNSHEKMSDVISRNLVNLYNKKIPITISIKPGTKSKLPIEQLKKLLNSGNKATIDSLKPGVDYIYKHDGISSSEEYKFLHFTLTRLSFAEQFKTQEVWNSYYELIKHIANKSGGYTYSYSDT